MLNRAQLDEMDIARDWLIRQDEARAAESNDLGAARCIWNGVKLSVIFFWLPLGAALAFIFGWRPW